MTQKEVEILKKSFLDSLETYVNARLQNLDFVKTQIGVVTDVTLNTDDNRYYHTVACNVTSATSGVTYENIVSLDNTQYGVNSIVFLLAPNAQFTNQFILGGLDPLPSETINYGDLQGKPSINGVTLLGNKTTADLHITASIDYGTTIPTGGSNGDVYFQNDGTNVIAIWQKVSGTWIDLTGNSSSIDYGINDPTGGEDGDTYIQVAPPYVNANLQYANASTWVFDGFSDNKRTLTMHGTASSQWEYVYFYLQGLTIDTQYTLLFDAKFSDNTTFYNGGWVLGMCVNGTFNPVNYESQITNQAYVSFKRDTNKNSYTLTFTATSNSMYLWVQPTDVTDGVSSTLVISNFAVTTSGEREGIKALWINSSGTWQKGEFDNKDFTGATSSTDGIHGLVPAPLAGDENKYLCGDGTWKHINYKDGTTNGYKRTNLFTSDTVVYNTTINLSDHMLNYDIIEIVYGFASTDKTHETIWIDAEYFVNNFPYVNTTSNTHNHILLSPYDNGYTRVTLGQGGDNTLCSYLTNNYNVTGIYEVNGITLGNKYTKTLLWDYQNDNSGVIPFNTYIKTLNEDINNYDVLLVELVSSKSDLTNVNWNSTIQWQINIDSLNNSYNSNYITFTTFGDRASRYYIKDTTFQCATCNITDTNGLVRVYGILYGNDKNKRGKELIYTGTSRVNTITIDDNKSMYDYDAILLQGTVTTSSGTFENTMFYITSDTEFVDGKQIGINDDASYLWYTIGDNGTTLTFLGSAGYAYYISSIYGINFNAGEGSGEIPTTETPQIPIMISNTSPSGVASASSILGANFDAYMAFNGQSANLQTMNGGWLASNSDSAPWLKYHFDSAVKFDSIKIETANNSTATSKVIYIEGSNDDVTWENVLLNSESVTLIFALREYTNYTFNLNGESYTYLRLRGVEPFYGGTNQYACTFSKVQLYTIESDLSYNILSNKPQINGVDLIGNKTTSQLIPIDSSLTINNNGELGVANSNNIDQLYTSSTIASIINLSNNVSMYDYDCILIQSTVINDSGTFENTTYYITSDSKFIDGYNIGVTDNINYLWYTIGNSGSRLTLIPDTQLVNTSSYQIYISAIYGINIKGGNSNNHSYSLSEKIVDTWIDGRPIYEITFIIDGGLNFSNTSQIIPTSAFDWNAHNVDLFISGMALRYNTSSYKAGCTLASPWISNNDFKITINGTWNALTHFTIRYTKTTD